MKNLTWILFLCYFLVFILAGFLIYQRYFKDTFFGGSTPPKVEVIENEYIYYSAGNNLFRADVNAVLSDPLGNHMERFQSTGRVDRIDFSKPHNLLSFSAQDPNGFSNTWQVELSTNDSTKISTADAPLLKDFIQFLDPKFSNDGSKLVFIGRDSIKDSIIIKDLSSNTFSLLPTNFTEKISDFSFNQSGDKLVACSAGASQNSCKIIDFTSGQILQTFNADANFISWNQSQNMIFLDKGNIFSLSENTKTPTQITNIKAPKKAKSFSLDSDATNITYDVQEGTDTEIYFSHTDGTNLIQLTNDKISFSPAISPAGDKIAYLKQNDGIYVTDTAQSVTKKLINSQESINYLLSWR